MHLVFLCYMHHGIDAVVPLNHSFAQQEPVVFFFYFLVKLLLQNNVVYENKLFGFRSSVWLID